MYLFFNNKFNSQIKEISFQNEIVPKLNYKLSTYIYIHTCSIFHLSFVSLNTVIKRNKRQTVQLFLFKRLKMP